jgi:L-aspartate oxidase
MLDLSLMLPAPRSVLTTLPRAIQRHHSDLLIIGGGAAGLVAALHAAEHVDVTLLTRATPLESNSARAQGGVAAALDENDAPPLHVEDTLIAGAGLCDEQAVAILTHAAPALMFELAALGVPFEQQGDGFALGLEGGHSHRRILHVGDATGWAITNALAKRALAHPRITIREGFQAVDLLKDGERVVGVLALDALGGWHDFLAPATILATGGAGALYGLTSNGPGALGEGIALAYRAGAAIADMEFVQFHPTVMRTQSGEGFLITEAARGEGAILLDVNGRRFMPEYDPRAELAPRDIVARGIFAAMQATNSDHVLLDMTHFSAHTFEHHFPTISARCRAEGLDPATTPIPIAPAAHYLMGGICTDLRGATSLPGLYAAGECACTGVHGANRLASNSLLECMVFGRQAAAAALEALSQGPRIQPNSWTLDVGREPLPTAHLQPQPDWRNELAQLMRMHAGLIRCAEQLRNALSYLDAFPRQISSGQSDAITAANAVLAARLVVAGALIRSESRGAHFRSDYPETSKAWQGHVVFTRGQQPRMVNTIASVNASLKVAA